MNRIAAIALFAIATLASAGSASAQFADKFDIPFAFSVGGTVLPAGPYVVVARSRNMLELLDTKLTVSAIVVTGPNERIKPETHGKMVFNKYGDQYFLHQVVSPASDVDADVSPSKKETNARLELAKANGSQPILVAIK